MKENRVWWNHMNHKKELDTIKKNSYVGWLLIFPSLIGVLMFYIIPFFEIIILSFSNKTNTFEFNGVNNYIDVVKSKSFLSAMKNSILFMIITLIVILCFSMFIAIKVNSFNRGKLFFLSSFLLPCVLPVVAIVKIWNIIWHNGGIINALLHLSGVEVIDWTNSKMSFVVIVALYIWKNTGINILVYFFGLLSIPKEYYEVASIEGANRIQTFLKITLIYLIPYTLFNIILFFINSFKIFREIYLMFGEYPQQNVYMLQHFMNNLFNSLNYPQIASTAVILLIIITIVIYFLNKAIKNYIY